MSDKEQVTAYKHLKLVTPDSAWIDYGISAEAPAFVSPWIPPNRPGNYCTVCETSFSPLIYQTGYQVESQHFLRDECFGGIYFYPDLREYSVFESWIATIKLLGKVDQLRNSAEAVYVESIRAICSKHGESLDQGFVVLPSNGNFGLKPFCNEEMMNLEKNLAPDEKWQFEVVDGSIHFRPM